jgi:hypothetical protein
VHLPPTHFSGAIHPPLYLHASPIKFSLIEFPEVIDKRKAKAAIRKIFIRKKCFIL